MFHFLYLLHNKSLLFSHLKAFIIKQFYSLQPKAWVEKQRLLWLDRRSNVKTPLRNCDSMFWLNYYLIHPENTSQTLENNHWLQTCCPHISIKFCLCVGLSHPPRKHKAVIFLLIDTNFGNSACWRFTLTSADLHKTLLHKTRTVDLWSEGALCSLNRQREQFQQLITLLMYIWVC